ncbi:hypothetical protein F4777DRAFT_574722 [Nemania sp. FL0916]|nr:hypothetical protein F4777DRAFT_574722 [Nemania sp. FL0916]
MKFLGALALLASGAHASLGIGFTSDIPVDAFYKIGSNFALEWKAYDASATDTFELSISAWNSTPSGYTPGPFGSQIPVYDTVDVVLDSNVKFLDQKYLWPVNPIDGNGIFVGEEFYYSFTAHFGLTWDSPRAFHIED